MRCAVDTVAIRVRIADDLAVEAMRQRVVDGLIGLAWKVIVVKPAANVDDAAHQGGIDLQRSAC